MVITKILEEKIDKVNKLECKQKKTKEKIIAVNRAFHVNKKT